MIILREQESNQSHANIMGIMKSLGMQSENQLNILDLKGQIFTEIEAEDAKGPSNTVLIAPFTLLKLLSSYDERSSSRSLNIPRSIKKIFLHSYKPSKQIEQTVLEMFADKTARLCNLSSNRKCFRFSEFKDICGPFYDMEIQCEDSTQCWGLVSESPKTNGISPILQCNSNSVLLCLQQEDRKIFMLFTSELADVEQVVTRNLNVYHDLLSLVAPYMILKYLSHGLGWMPNRIYANIIIDDPPLTLKHGFADFTKIKKEITDRGLSMTLAFIPFNYKKGSDKSIAFFKDAQDRISICVHGYNHTKAEFGISNNAKVNSMAALACERMEDFKKRTGLPYSRIMVFPQGSFSSQSMAALKHNHFLAAVNTELHDVTGQIQIKLKDLLTPAIMSYHSFPLFLRRKLSEGLSNLALDMLIGKPCLIVTHHEDFREDSAPVWKMAESLSALQKHVEWRSLKYIVTHSTLLRKVEKDKLVMYGFSKVVNLESLANLQYTHCRLVKLETEPERVRTVTLDGREVQASFGNGETYVELPEKSGIRIAEFVFEGDRGALDFTYRQQELFAIWLRRFLCDVRDNYFSKIRL